MHTSADKLDGVSARWRKKRRRDSCDEEVREEEEEETNLIESTELAAADGPRDRKRVRWADLEEQKEEHRRRLQMGFVLGSSWARVPEEQVTAILHGQRRVSSTSSD